MTNSQQPHYTESPAYQRAMHQLESDQRMYAEEMRQLEEGGDDPFGEEEWKQAMIRLGRL